MTPRRVNLLDLSRTHYEHVRSGQSSIVLDGYFGNKRRINPICIWVVGEVDLSRENNNVVDEDLDVYVPRSWFVVPGIDSAKAP